MRHVLEHLHDPKSDLIEINRISKNGGLLLVETPNIGINNLAVRLDKYWVEFDLPRHLFHFTALCLTTFTTEIRI